MKITKEIMGNENINVLNISKNTNSKNYILFNQHFKHIINLKETEDIISIIKKNKINLLILEKKYYKNTFKLLKNIKNANKDILVCIILKSMKKKIYLKV